MFSPTTQSSPKDPGELRTRPATSNGDAADLSSAGRSALRRAATFGALAALLLPLAACTDGSTDGATGGSEAARVEAPELETGPARRVDGVILFVVDTLRADRMSAYGADRPTTPAFDALAERGTLYRRNYTQGSWTIPAMLSMLSGLSIAEESDAFPAATPTLAELLSESGVETAGFVGNRILSGERGFMRGFGVYQRPNPDVPKLFARNTKTATWVARFVEWYGSRSAPERPWFAWIHSFDPHQPYTPSRPFDVFHARSDYEKDVLVPRWHSYAPEVDALNADLEDAWDTNRAITSMAESRLLYDGEVRETDHGLRTLVEWLDSWNGFEHVLLVVAADHGEMLWEYEKDPARVEAVVRRTGGLPYGLADRFASKHTLNLEEELMHTPLLLVGPGVPAGRVETDLSANLDIFPTVLDAMGVRYDGRFDGTSKFRTEEPRRFVFGIGGDSTTVVTDNGLRLIHEEVREASLVDEFPPRTRLFRTGHDQGGTDIAAERAAIVEGLMERIARWRKDVGFETTMLQDPESQHEVLQSLGYIDPDLQAPDGQER
ncbi:MAG: sulfatase-like hydrolase/transferase [Planctomycetota bacterium]